MCETFGLRKYMTFNTEVIGCYWEEERGEWLVKLRESRQGQESREFEERCHLLLHGTGILVGSRCRSSHLKASADLRHHFAEQFQGTVDDLSTTKRFQANARP